MRCRRLRSHLRTEGRHLRYIARSLWLANYANTTVSWAEYNRVRKGQR